MHHTLFFLGASWQYWEVGSRKGTLVTGTLVTGTPELVYVEVLCDCVAWSLQHVMKCTQTAHSSVGTSRGMYTCNTVTLSCTRQKYQINNKYGSS